MDSKYKPIPGYNGYLISEDGVVYSEKTSHFMKIRMLGCYKYPVVVFYNNKKNTVVPVHKLVALAWLPIPQSWSLNEVLGNYESKRLVVHHKDNNKMNYKASNLEWTTQYENANKDDLNKKRSEAMKGNKHAKGHRISDNHKRYRYFLNGQEMTVKELTNFLKCSRSKITESFRRNLGLVRTGMLTREEK